MKAATVAELVTGDIPDANSEHNAYVYECIESMMMSDGLGEIFSEDAVSVKDGGRMAPFDLHDFRAGMKSPRKMYNCGFNLMKLNLFWSSDLLVPRSRTRLDRLETAMSPHMAPPH